MALLCILFRAEERRPHFQSSHVTLALNLYLCGFTITALNRSNFVLAYLAQLNTSKNNYFLCQNSAVFEIFQQ